MKTSCILCGSKKDTYKLTKDGGGICPKCMRQGKTKDALDLWEHNKNADRLQKEGK